MNRTLSNLRRLTAALLIAALLPLGGCVGSKEPPKVTLVLKTTVETAEFWAQVMDGVEAAAQELSVDLTVTGASAETEVDEQIAIMEDVIAQKPDVIVLVSADYDRLTESTRKAVQAGIKVVTMDSDVNTDLRSCYVASDNTKIGRSMGRQMLDSLPDGKVAVLTHSTTASSGIDRVGGALAVLQTNPDIEIVGVYDCRNDMETARSLVREILQEHPDLAGFVCTNEVCNLAVAACLVEQSLASGIVVVGCDNSEQQIRYLEQNVIQGIVIQRPFSMGYTAIQTATQVAGGEPVSDFLEISCVSITRDNMYKSENQKLLFPF